MCRNILWSETLCVENIGWQKCIVGKGSVGKHFVKETFCGETFCKCYDKPTEDQRKNNAKKNAETSG